MLIKIPIGLATAIAAKRELRTRYFTNRAFKAVETYLYLKALTTSGKIQAYEGESRTGFYSRVAAQCELSHNAFINRLKEASDLFLLSYNEQAITLRSFEKVCFDYGIKKEFLEYDNKDNKSLEHILKALAIRENQNQQAFVFNKKLKANPAILKELRALFPTCHTADELRAAMEKALTTLYRTGSKILDFFKQLNPCLSVSNKTLKKIFGFKSSLSSTYLKRCLSIKKMLTVQNTAPISTHTGKRMGEYSGFYFFERKTKCLTWFAPQKLQVCL